MTYFGFAATVGGIFGLQSGGFLTEERGWRSVFVLCVALAAVITVGGLVSRAAGAAPVAPGAAPAELAHGGRPAGSVAAALAFNFLVFVNYGVWVTLPLYTEHAFDASAETQRQPAAGDHDHAPGRGLPGRPGDPALGGSAGARGGDGALPRSGRP